MTYNRITAEIGESRRITTRPISYQYDTVQILMLTAAEGIELPEFYQVDFCVIGDEDTVTMVGSLSGGAPIPDSLLRQGENLVAYLVLTGAEGDVQTRYEITIPVNERPTRSGIELSDDQQAQVDSLIEALNDGVDRAEAAVEAVQDMGVEAETLAAGSAASVEKEVDPETGAVTLIFGIPRGSQGNPGTTPDFQIGTVETLPATSPATATITGTPAEPVLNLGIPQGQKGDPGGSTGTTDYRELENKPQINGHTLNGDQSASDLGLGTYSKPGTGIPKTDLASDVQQSLDKADSALQSAPVSSVAGKTGAVQLNAGDIEFDDSETYAAGSIGAEVSQQKNAIEQKQDATSYVTLSGTIVTQTGADNTMYLCGELAELTFTAPQTGITAIRFTSGTTPTVATFSGVTWLNGFDPSAIEANKTYEVNILNGLGCAAWT